MLESQSLTLAGIAFALCMAAFLLRVNASRRRNRALLAIKKSALKKNELRGYFHERVQVDAQDFILTIRSIESSEKLVSLLVRGPHPHLETVKRLKKGDIVELTYNHDGPHFRALAFEESGYLNIAKVGSACAVH